MANEKRFVVITRHGKGCTIWGDELPLLSLLDSDLERIQAMNVGETYEDLSGGTWERKQ